MALALRVALSLLLAAVFLLLGALQEAFAEPVGLSFCLLVGPLELFHEALREGSLNAQGVVADHDPEGQQAQEELRAKNLVRIPKVIEAVRGIGLMWGIKCGGSNVDLANRLIDRGLLVILAADNVVRLLPPLIINDDHLDEAFEIIETCCSELNE